ncbi:PASTA domain-containing protein [Streptomyces sp. NPDC054950]
MANWKLIGGITAGVIIIGGIGSACDDGSTNTGSTGTTTAVSNTPTTEPAKTDDTTSSKTETKAVPNFIGMGLQSAQDTAQAAGFYVLDSHDSLGRDRLQALDRNWKVCTQSVAGGKTVPTDTTLDFGSVKLEEDCPATDQKAPEAAGATMPDFKGKSVKAARAALDSGTSMTVKDASSDSRFILVESNWQVCSQSPDAGAKLNGQPVEFTAAKFGESCP